jgi:hypothetical protein
LSADRNGSISGIERVAAALLLAGAAAGAIVAPGFLAGREPAVPPASAVGAPATTVVQAAPLPRQKRTLPTVRSATAAPVRSGTPVQHAHVTRPATPAVRPHTAPATPPAVTPAAPPASDSATVASAQTLTPLASVPVASVSTDTGNGHGKSQGRGPKQSPPPQAQPPAPAAAAAAPLGDGNNGNGKGNGQGHDKGSA